MFKVVCHLLFHAVILKDGYSNYSSHEKAGEGDCWIFGSLGCSRGEMQTEYPGGSAKDSTDCLAMVTIQSTIHHQCFSATT